MTNQISIGSRVSFKNGEDTLEGIVMENCYDNVYKGKSGESFLVIDATCFNTKENKSDEPILQSEPPKPKRGRKPMK